MSAEAANEAQVVERAEEGLRPQLAEQDPTMSDEFVISKMSSLLVNSDPQGEMGEERARETALALLALRGPDGLSKLLFTRRDVFEIFRRQQQKLAPVEAKVGR